MSSSFKLHSDDSEFNNRVDALFSSLQTAAVDLDPQINKRTWEESSAGGDDKDDDSYCRIGGEREQKFKKPEGMAPKWRGGGGGGPRRGFYSVGGNNRTNVPRNSTPDYVKNPQNWTRYSMKDTKVLSDRENKQVGLQLFDELRSKRQKAEEEEAEMGNKDDAEMNECPKIVFKKPVKLEAKDSEKDDSDRTHENADAIFGGSKKFKMEEYKVGQSKQKSKNKNRSKKMSDEGGDNDQKKGDAVKLNYLMYEDEEDNDD